MFNFYVSNFGNTASLRELNVAWTDSTVTYASLPFDAASWGATEIAAVPGSTGWRSVDVTSSVQAWLAGSTNNGWIVLPTGGNNGGQMRFSDYANYEPFLAVDVVTPPISPPSPAPPMPPMPPPTNELVFNGVNSDYTGGCQSTFIRQHLPDFNGGTVSGLWWDGNSATGFVDAVLVQFTDIIGHGPNQLRPHEAINTATLRYNIDTSYSSNAPGASATLAEISVPWNSSTVTWNSFVGSAGLNADDYRTPTLGVVGGTPTGWHEIDVTASVTSFLNGADNNGCESLWRSIPRRPLISGLLYALCLYLLRSSSCCSPKVRGYLPVSAGIWIPTGGGDGTNLRACNAPADRRVNLHVVYLLAPPAPPSPPSPPPPPPAPPSPPPSPPQNPFSTMTISGPDVTQHGRLRSSSGYRDSNYASSTLIYWDGNTATNRDFVTLKFDLAALSGYTIERAYLHYRVGNEGNLAEMHELRVNWDMSNVTYNNLPLPAGAWPWSHAEADALYGPSVNDLPGATGDHTVDVTASVSRWLSGTPNYGCA